MKIEFAGAAQGVTGSKHLFHINGKKILLDCGLFQGRRKQAIKWNQVFPFDAKEIDAVVLSHAHIDHSGAIPLLVKNGFEGPIYCTHATRDLCSIMLQDSAHIQERDAEWINKKNKNNEAQPLYTVADTRKALSLFRSVNYHHKFYVVDGVKVEFYDAGHILGSCLELWHIHDHKTGQRIRLGFTGDLGRKTLPILKDRETLTNLDFLLTESTYGDRLHDEILEVEDDFAKKVEETYQRGGKVFIPAFAVERTQEILYILKYLMHKKKITPMPIFIDSPLAVSATEVFRLHPECFDEALCQLLDEGKDPFTPEDGVQFTQSVDESKALNNFPGPAIIISASGMCEFGRIKHHLANGISDPKNTIIVVGWMAANTLGRKIIEGENPVNIFSTAYPVNAEIEVFNAFSGHADQRGLLEFASEAGDLQNIFLVHGESKQQKVFAQKLRELDNIKKDTEIFIPAPGDIYELEENKKFKKSKDINQTTHDLFFS